MKDEDNKVTETDKLTEAEGFYLLALYTKRAFVRNPKAILTRENVLRRLFSHRKKKKS